MRASEFTPRKKSNKVAESAWHKRMSFEQLVQYIIDYLGPEPSDSAIVDAVKGEAEDAGVDPNKLFDAVYDRIRPHVEEDWQKVNKHDKTDGMSKKAVSAYRREHPGSKLKTAVTKKPSKLKKGSKDANRRKSFCARMKGMKKSRASAKTKHNPDSPINKALRRWNCESIEEMRDMIAYAEQKISLLKEAANPAQQAAIAIAKKKEQGVDEKWSAKYKKSINCSHPKGFSQRAHCAGKKKHNESVTLEMVCPECGMCQSHGNLNEIKKGQKDSNGVTKCWPGYRAQGTKKGKNGSQVRNCVKIGEGWEHEMARLLRLLESK